MAKIPKRYESPAVNVVSREELKAREQVHKFNNTIDGVQSNGGGVFAFLISFLLVIAVIRFLYNGQGFSTQSFLEFLQTVKFTDMSNVYQWTASAVWEPDWGAFDWLGEFFAMFWNSLLSVIDVSTFISNGALNVIEVCIQFLKYLF